MNYNAIDLGLPSGTKWCDRNVGASSPEESGLYFAWGETDGYAKDDIKFDNCPKEYNWGNYKFGRYDKFSEYNKKDKKKMLDLEDDAAYINMGSYWSMPTIEQFKELLEYTTNEWVSDYNGTGISGRLFTSKINGNSIFVPAAGYAFDGSVNYVGDVGNLWSSSLYEDDADFAWNLSFDSGSAVVYSYSRFYGFPVRGIVNDNKKYFTETDKEVIENIISVAESLDFSVTVYPYKDEEIYNIEFSKYSTVGRDFNFNIEVYSDSTESDIAQKIYDYYEDFDVSYETYIYLDNFGHGINGAPDDMIDVYNDTKECESFIEELASAINNKEF